jgi:hypothetical protein
MKEGYINIPIEHFDPSTTPTVTNNVSSKTPTVTNNVSSTTPTVTNNVSSTTPTVTNNQNKSIKLYVWTETGNNQTILKYSTHNTKLSGLHLSIREKNNNTINWSSEQGNADACDWFVKINNFNKPPESIPSSTRSILGTTESIPVSTPSSSSESFYNFEPFQATGGNTTTNSVIGTTNSVKGTTNSVIGTTNSVIGTTNSVIGTTNSVIGTTNSVIGTTASAVTKEITAKVILLYNGEDFDTLASNSVNSKNKENILGQFDGEFEIVEIIGASDNNNQDIIKEELSGGPPVSGPETTTTGVPQTTTTVGCITRQFLLNRIMTEYVPMKDPVLKNKIKQTILDQVMEWHSYRFQNPNICKKI